MVNEIRTAYGDASAGLVDPIDIHREIKRKNVEKNKTDILVSANLTGDPGGRGHPIETNWLVSAAKAYNISPDIKDYIMVPVPLFYADIPNKNGFGFALENLVQFSPEHGVPRYKTWKGKPTFYNHDHKDVSKANGVVLDTFLRQIPAKNRMLAGPKGDYWKELAYLALDRGKYRELVSEIANKSRMSYSMATKITKGYVCSVCGRDVGLCTHLNMKKPKHGMKLVDTGKEFPELAYAIGRDPVGFEVSVVDTPAYPMAENDNVQMFPVK